MDDVVPLAVQQISHYESDIEPKEDVIWVEKYTAHDLRKMKLEDETTAEISRWLNDDHRPSQAELAQASPAIKYFWLLRRQLVVLSGVVYYKRVEQESGSYGNRGVGVLVAPEPLQKTILDSKRHSLQAVELSQRTQVAVQIVSNIPAPSNGGPIYLFLGMPAMRTRWMAGVAAHKSG